MTEKNGNFGNTATFDIGRVIKRTFSPLKNNFSSFFLAALIIVGLPMFLLNLWPLLMTPGIANNGTLSSNFFQA